MKRLYLIRHGESISNAGGRTDAPHSTLITPKGHAQAAKLADAWAGETPKLIVTSPFIRTKDTAMPFVKRFRQASRAEWRVEEFTPLEPKNWSGTTHSERMPKVHEYWERADPQYLDGPGAETFVEFIGRVRAMLTLAAERPEENIVVFTHGHFIQATLWTVLSINEYPTPDLMKRFFQFAKAWPIDNTACVQLFHGETWTVGAIQPPVLP